MNFTTRSLYVRVKKSIRIPKRIWLGLALLSIITPLHVIGTDPLAPYEQEFVLTAYYSPIEGQCCYVRGGLAADRRLNGQGHTAADGTSVYLGMLAAPPLYAFGTVIDLPGLGVMKVHDRGGAIQVFAHGEKVFYNQAANDKLPDDAVHRLDVYMGAGEAGLARALAFGVQTMTATVYPVGSEHPAVGTTLAEYPAPHQRLEPYAVHDRHLVGLHAHAGDKGLTVVTLQNTLKQLGYHQSGINGMFDESTQESLRRFNVDHGLSDSGEQMNGRIGAYLLAALRRSVALENVTELVDAEASPQAVTDAQRILRFLGYYRGRSDGVYDDGLQASILKFQQDHLLVGTAEDPGAGRIGPITKRTLNAQWNKRLVANRAQKYLALQRVDEHLDERGLHLDRFLEEGYGGQSVVRLQELLAERGHFPEDEEKTGYFGPKTKQAVIAYQLAEGLITSAHSPYAGNVGIQTLQRLRQQERSKHYQLVKAEGWQAL